MNKLCSQCGLEWMIGCFYRDNTQPDGYKSICRACGRKTNDGCMEVVHTVTSILPFGHKRCAKCKIGKPFFDFHKASAQKDGYACYCKKCEQHRSKIQADKNWSDPVYRANRSKIEKQVRIKKAFEKVGPLLEFQGNVCAICGSSTPGGRGTFHLDHSHDESGENRGWLCHWCNVGLGHVKDNIKTLESMIEYLKDPPLRRMNRLNTVGYEMQ
jgi:Recombination endonuclease VII